RLPVESVVPRLTAAAAAAQFSAQGNTSTALAAVTEVVVNMLEDPDAFVLSVETDMAEFADFDTDQEAVTALLPRALGSPFFLSLGLGAVEIVDQVAAAFLDESREVALNEMFLLSWASFVASEVVMILLTMMVYSNRDQAEIRSRHKYFYIHFLFGALILPFVAIFFVGVALFQFTYDPDVNAALFTTATSLMAIVGIMFVLVPFTYRQRFMYVVFKVRKFRYQSYYFVLLPYHIGLTLVVIAGHLWCYYDHDSCTVYYDYVFITFAIVAILIEFVYYSYRLGTQTYTTLIFVDSWQAARLIFLWGTSYAVGYAYTGWRNTKMLSALWISWQLIILTTGAVFDYFLLLSLKAFTRRNGYDFITELNMAGNANQMVDLDNISILLDDSELRTLFVEFSEYRHCSEMPKFLVCMREVERRYRATDDEHVRVCEIDEAIRRITAEFVTPAVLNIAGEVQALLVHNLSELYGVSVTRRYTSSVSANFVLNTDSYQSHQAINFPAEGPPPDTDWDEVLDWFRPAYHQIQTILRMSVLPVFRQSPQLMQILENRHAQQDALQRDGVLHATTPAFNMSERVRYIANTEIVRANSSDGSASNRRSERGRHLLGDAEGSTRTFEAVPRAALGAVDTKGDCLSSGHKTGRAPVLQRGTNTSMMAIDSDLAGSGRHDVYNMPAAGTSPCKPLKPGNSPGQQAALQANSVLDVDGGGLCMNLNGPQSLHRSMSSDRTTQSDRNTHAYEHGQNPYTPKYLHMRTFTRGDADSSVETHKPTSSTKDMQSSTSIEMEKKVTGRRLDIMQALNNSERLDHGWSQPVTVKNIAEASQIPALNLDTSHNPAQETPSQETSKITTQETSRIQTQALIPDQAISTGVVKDTSAAATNTTDGINPSTVDSTDAYTREQDIGIGDHMVTEAKAGE
ncbi:hypothetical protein SARC_10614, partial [Sphaeroforma arctica JP610]